MSVQNGQIANETTFNSAFLSRLSNSDTVAKIDLANIDTTTLIDLQRVVNEIASSLGVANQAATDATANTYSSNEIITDGDDRKVAIGKIDGEFNNSTGHSHSGLPGEGAPIGAENLANFNNFFAEYESQSFTGASGFNIDVSADFSGESPGGDASTEGVITAAPNNEVSIIEDDGSEVVDGSGRRVYARLTEGGGVWTLTFYVNIGGTETTHSLASTNIEYIYRKVFTAANRPTIGANVGVFDSKNATADTPDATATQRGLVSTGGQIWAGVKQFQSTPNVLGVDVVTQTATETLSNKTLDSTNTFSGEVVDPTRLDVKKDTEANLITYALTASDGQLVFATDTQTLYQIINNALEPAGGGAGGGGGALNFVSPNLAENDDTANYSTGNDAVFDAVAPGAFQGTYSLSSSGNDLIFGASSYKVVLNATPGTSNNDYVASGSVAIPQGFRGRNLVFRFRYNYNGADNDIKMVIKDNTNTVLLAEENLPAFSNAENTAQDFSFVFFCPDDCDAIKWGPQVSTHASGSEELVYNIIEVTPELLVSAIIDGENSFAAVVQNNGTASIVSQGPENFISSVNRTSQGAVTVNFVAGFFTEDPSIAISVNGTGEKDRSIVASNITSSGFTCRLSVASTAANIDADFSFVVTRQGEDAQDPSENIVVANRSYGATLYQNTAGSVVPAGTSVLNFPTKISDANSLVVQSPNTRWVSAKSGTVSVNGNVRVAAYTGNDPFDLYLYKNGSLFAILEEKSRRDVDSDLGVVHLVGGLSGLPVNRGDFLELYILNGSGGARSLASSGFTNFFSVVYDDVKPLSAFPGQQVAYLKDIKVGANGGSCTGGGTFDIRTINTIEGDTSFVSLPGSNQFRLQAGSYDIEISAEAYLVAANILRIFDVSNSAVVAEGQSCRANADIQQTAILKTRLVVSTTTNYRIEHAGNLARATTGFGNIVAFASQQTYLTAKITKVR